MNLRGLGEEKGFAVSIKGLTDVLVASENSLLAGGMEGFKVQKGLSPGERCLRGT